MGIGHHAQPELPHPCRFFGAALAHRFRREAQWAPGLGLQVTAVQEGQACEPQVGTGVGHAPAAGGCSWRVCLASLHLSVSPLENFQHPHLE